MRCEIALQCLVIEEIVTNLLVIHTSQYWNLVIKALNQLLIRIDV